MGLTLFGEGGVCFMGVVFYALVDKMRTGVLFRQRRIVIPLAFGSWFLAMVGMLIVFLSNNRSQYQTAIDSARTAAVLCPVSRSLSVIHGGVPGSGADDFGN